MQNKHVKPVEKRLDFFGPKTKILTLGLAAACCLGVAGQAYADGLPDGFTDSVFYECIENSFKDSFPDEPVASTGLTDEQIARIQNVFCNKNQNEQNIDGYEKLTGMQAFFYYSPKANLGDLDFSHSPELKSITLIAGVSTVNVRNNPALERIGLNDTRGLTQIDVSQNALLTELAISGGNFDTIDVSNNPLLEALAIDNCHLKSLDISKNVNLNTLAITGNELTSIDITKNPNLFDLRADDILIKVDADSLPTKEAGNGLEIELVPPLWFLRVTDFFQMMQAIDDTEQYSFDPETGALTIFDANDMPEFIQVRYLGEPGELQDGLDYKIVLWRDVPEEPGEPEEPEDDEPEVPVPNTGGNTVVKDGGAKENYLPAVMLAGVAITALLVLAVKKFLKRA